MACLKRLLPAGYSGYSQIPAQSGSRSLPRWTKPPPAPGALLQTFINPFVLRAVSFEAQNLACGFLQYISLLSTPNFFFIFFFPPALNSLVRFCWLPPQSRPWLGGEARGWAGSAGVRRGDAPAPGAGRWRWSLAAAVPRDLPQTWAGSNPLCLLPSPRLGLDSSAGETLSLKGHCLNQHLNDIPNLFLKFINPFVFSSSKTLSQDIM